MSHLPDAQRFEKHYHLQVNFGTAAYEIPNYAKLWYRTVWNIINTGSFTVPVYRASLLPTTVKSTKSWLNDHVLVCLTGQQTHQTWTLKRIYGVLSRGKLEIRDQTMQMSWRPLSKKPELPYHLSSAKNWSPPCPRRIEAVIKAKGAPTNYWVHIQ